MPRIKYFDSNSNEWKYADQSFVGSTGQKDVLLYVQQSLTEEQKQQSRVNIGAVSVKDIQQSIEEAIGAEVETIVKESSIIDDLASTSIRRPLSANQGKVLNDLIVGVQGQIEETQSLITGISEELEGKAPLYIYSTTDLTAGTSPLATGVLYFVYE